MKRSDLQKQRLCCLPGELIGRRPKWLLSDIKKLSQESGRRWWQPGLGQRQVDQCERYL